MKLTSANQIAVLFSASWCKNCPQAYLVIEEIEALNKDIIWYSCDVDSCTLLSDEYSIQSVPTIVLLNKDKKSQSLLIKAPITRDKVLDSLESFYSVKSASINSNDNVVEIEQEPVWPVCTNINFEELYKSEKSQDKLSTGVCTVHFPFIYATSSNDNNKSSSLVLHYHIFRELPSMCAVNSNNNLDTINTTQAYESFPVDEEFLAFVFNKSNWTCILTQKEEEEVGLNKFSISIHHSNNSTSEGIVPGTIWTRNHSSPIFPCASTVTCELTSNQLYQLYHYKVPRITLDVNNNACSNPNLLSKYVFDLSERNPNYSPSNIFPLIHHPETKRMVQLSYLVDYLYEVTRHAEWIGIYRLIQEASGDYVLLKESYRGEPSRPFFPVTEAFCLKSTNSTVARRGIVRYIPNTRETNKSSSNGDTVSYYECSTRVQCELCLPILQRRDTYSEGGEDIEVYNVIGIIDIESWNRNHFEDTLVIERIYNIASLIGQYNFGL